MSIDTQDATDGSAGAILLVGASRGLGLGMAAEFARRRWGVVGTVRGSARTGLHELADAQASRVKVEALDITDPGAIAALRGRLGARRFDVLFVNAGTANRNQGEGFADVSTEDFVRVMLTNALGVMRAVEGLAELVRPDGLLGVMSSGQGSIGNNTRGGHEVYRGSKAALNQNMRSYAARHAGEPRAMALLAPGWIRTALGGPAATFGVEESIPKIVDVLLDQQGRPGLRFVDRDGKAVPW
jgi:NAD(P)-dependent dehydrogenase (short-subunit alcohol dehydrogenase family)